MRKFSILVVVWSWLTAAAFAQERSGQLRVEVSSAGESVSGALVTAGSRSAETPLERGFLGLHDLSVLAFRPAPGCLEAPGQPFAYAVTPSALPASCVKYAWSRTSLRRFSACTSSTDRSRL